MSNRLYFDGTGAYGTLDSEVSIASGDSVSFTFRSPYISGSTADCYIFASNDGTDGFLMRTTSGYEFGVLISGTEYTQGSTQSLFEDGEDHEITVTRSSANFLIYVDGVLDETIAASSDPWQVKFIADDPNVVKADFAVELSDLVIGSHTYPILTVPVDDEVSDTSGGGNDITLTDTIRSKVDLWEWVGDFTHIERTYATQNGSVSERRREGTRKRTVVGYPMESLLNKQAGTELDQDSDGVLAYNGGQISALKPIVLLIAPFTGTIDCDIEVFTPVTGTNFFTQTQTWVSYINSYPT